VSIYLLRQEKYEILIHTHARMNTHTHVSAHSRTHACIDSTDIYFHVQLQF